MLIGRQALLDDNADANEEPPYTEPFVRWCGRTAGATPPPTRLTPFPKLHAIETRLFGGFSTEADK